MKLGVSSYSFSKYMRDTHATYLEVCDLAKKIGFDGIEFTDLNTENQPASTEEELAQLIHDHCKKIGLDVVAYTIGADFMKGDEEVERVKKKVDVAVILGAKVLRHDATWDTSVDWRWAIDQMKDRIRAVTEYAATKGIRTCTENHGFLLQDAERVEALILAVNHPNYGWLVDMGNFLCADDNAIHALPIAAKYAFHVHVKDFLFKPYDSEDPGMGWFRTRNGSYLRGTVAGHGVVPIRYAIETLKKNNYQGYISYEFEGMEDNVPAIEAAYAYIRRILGE